MNITTLRKAKKEAAKFIKQCNEVEKIAEEDTYFWYGCRKSGALRRQSMELSSALIDFRQPS